MELIDTVIDILQAFKSGKAIEYFDIQEHKYIETNNPAFIIQSLAIPTRDIRVKPEPKYRPYNSAEEFLAATITHGDWIHLKGSIFYHKITRCASEGISILTEDSDGMAEYYLIPYKTLLENYIFSDGSVCGIIEE